MLIKSMRKSINNVYLFKFSSILSLSCILSAKYTFKGRKRENWQKFQCFLYNFVGISDITFDR